MCGKVKNMFIFYINKLKNSTKSYLRLDFNAFSKLKTFYCLCSSLPSRFCWWFWFFLCDIRAGSGHQGPVRRGRGPLQSQADRLGPAAGPSGREDAAGLHDETEGNLLKAGKWIHFSHSLYKHQKMTLKKQMNKNGISWTWKEYFWFYCVL